MCGAHAFIKCTGTATGIGTGPATGKRERNRDDAKKIVEQWDFEREGPKCYDSIIKNNFSHLWPHMVDPYGILLTLPYRIPFSRAISRFSADQCTCRQQTTVQK